MTESKIYTIARFLVVIFFLMSLWAYNETGTRGYITLCILFGFFHYNLKLNWIRDSIK